MASKRGYSASQVRQILLDSSDESSVVDSESEVESSEDDFEHSDSNESTETVIYDAGSNFAWSDRQCNEPTRLDFTGSPGRKAAIPDTSDVLHYFRLFLTCDALEMMVEETNKRSEELIQGLRKPKSRLSKWVDVDQK